jgi:hypothetical protein
MGKTIGYKFPLKVIKEKNVKCNLSRNILKTQGLKI